MAQLTRLITTIDSHTAGEGTRMVTSGLPEIRGANMGEKLTWASENLAWLPGYLLREPRGHKDLYGAVLVAPSNPAADIGVIFMNNGGFEPMCGHGLMGVATSVVELGIIQTDCDETVVKADTPAGLVQAKVLTRKAGVCHVAMENVPAFLLHKDVNIRLENGNVYYVDILFGGNFFAFVHASQINLELIPQNADRLAELGMQILEKVNDGFPPVHPDYPYINRITDLRFYEEVPGGGRHSRNVVILGNHMVDRSPCGTGTSAELALRYSRGEISLDEPWICESILGTRFEGCALAETFVGEGRNRKMAITPKIKGSAFITGFHQFVLQPDDPFPSGFLLK